MSSKRLISPLLKQTWVASGVLLNMISQGMSLAFPSSLLPALMEPHSEIKVDIHTASSIASSIGMSGILGFFLASFIMDNAGRRKAFLIMLLPMISGWILLHLSSNSTMLIFGRILCGITGGATTTLGAVCLGEYTDPVYRGIFLILKSTFVVLGVVSVHVVGNLCSWRTLAVIAIVLNVLSFLNTLTWPESPAYLASKKLFKKCSREFFWLRDKDERSTQELEELIQAQNNRSENRVGFANTCVANCKKFTQTDFLKPVFVVVVSLFLTEASGRHVFPAYLPQIITLITGNKIDSAYITFGMDILVLCSSLTSTVLVKIFRRRTLLFSTGILTVSSLALNSLYIFLVSKSLVPNTSSISIGLLASYLISSNLGCSSLPLLLFGELLPLPHKGFGTIIGGICFSLSMHLMLQITPYLLVSVNVYGTFAVYSSLLTCFLTILYFTLPETKDKTLQEIENYFRYGDYAVVTSEGIEDCDERDECEQIL